MAQNTSPRKLAMDAMALAKELFPQIEVEAKKHCRTKDWRNLRNFSERSRIVCTVQSPTNYNACHWLSSQENIFCNPISGLCLESSSFIEVYARFDRACSSKKTNLHHSFTFLVWSPVLDWSHNMLNARGLVNQPSCQKLRQASLGTDWQNVTSAFWLLGTFVFNTSKQDNHFNTHSTNFYNKTKQEIFLF